MSLLCTRSFSAHSDAILPRRRYETESQPRMLTVLSASLHDGAAGVYDYLYDGSCSCMVYRGAVHPLLHT